MITFIEVYVNEFLKNMNRNYFIKHLFGQFLPFIFEQYISLNGEDSLYIRNALQPL